MRFSFVLPAYKAKYLSLAIESILSQTLSDWELIVVDDCSPEDLKSIVDRYQDDRIRYYRNQENLGGENLVRQWNHSIKFANGDFIVLAADDDLYAPTFCEEMARLIDKYPTVDLVRSRVLQIDEEGNPLWDDGITEEFTSKYQYLHDWLVAKVFTCVGNFAFRRSALEAIGGFIDFPCAFGSDIATPIKLSVNGVANTSEMLFSFRQSAIHLSSDSRRFKEKLEAISQLSEWLRRIDYDSPLSESDKEAYSLKNDKFLHAKCVYDYFNLVIKYVPASKLYYLSYCRLATSMDKLMILLRWLKVRVLNKSIRTILAAFCMLVASGASAQDVVEFQHELPAMNITSPRNGTYNNYELGYPGILTTSDPDLGLMIWALRNSINQDRRLVFAEGRTLVCCNNWIRDHVHVMKSSCHWEYDLNSFLEFIIDHQRADGCYYELIKQIDDKHWSFVNEDCRIMLPEDNLALARLEVEADIEYLVVEGAELYYRVTGDKKWLRKVLPHLEKGIEFVTSDPRRWDEAHGLVKRAYTIDTWDFTYMPDAGDNRRIEPGKTPMSIMHGDNSGVWQAMNQLAALNRELGRSRKADYWESRAAALKENIFRYLWNGRHFVHQLPLNCPPYDEHEGVRLSLSNTYDINRGLTDIEQSRSIIQEYMARRDTSSAFAEWFSIDPPYKRFYIYDQGKYINGCISPFTAGELAKAALENGYESYGWDIIRRCMELVRRDGGVKFLYSPSTGMPASSGAGPSAWGAAAILSAIDESLAGIRNSGCSYNRISFCPRFPATHYKELRYFTGYEVNGTHVELRYILTDAGMRYQLRSPARRVDAHILLPDGKECRSVLVNGKNMPFSISRVGDSRYVDMGMKADGVVDIQILF